MTTPPHLPALFALLAAMGGTFVHVDTHADALDAGVVDQARQVALQAATLAAGQAGATGQMGRTGEAGQPGQAALRPKAGVPRVEVIPGTLDPRLRLAPCERVEAFLPAGARAWGRTRIGLRCEQGATRWSVSLPLTVRVWAPGVVLAAALPAGSVLAAEHLGLAEVDWAADPAGAFADPARLVGRTLARPLNAGATPRPADLKARQWFAAGDTVRLVASGPGFAISGDATALSPGVEGQAVRVRTEGGRVISARPVGERRVEVGL